LANNLVGAARGAKAITFSTVPPKGVLTGGTL